MKSFSGRAGVKGHGVDGLLRVPLNFLGMSNRPSDRDSGTRHAVGLAAVGEKNPSMSKR